MRRIVGLVVISACGGGGTAPQDAASAPDASNPPQPLALSFAVTPSTPVGIAPIAIATGDVDGNGRADFAVVDNGTDGNGSGLYIISGAPGGDLAIALHATGEWAVSAPLVDLDGDGADDLIAASTTGVTVRRNLGQYQFASPVSVWSGGLASNVAAGLLDGDAVLDLAITTQAGLQVAIGNGDATFAAPSAIALSTPPTGVAIADVTGDGSADVIVVEQSGGADIFAGHGDATFDAPVPLAPGTAAWHVRVASLGGGAGPDLVLRGATNYVLLDDGAGGFAPPAAYLGGDVAPADLDGDGDVDLAIADGGQVTWLHNAGDGTFAEAGSYAAGRYPGAVAAGDIDGDGHVDLAVANLWDGTVSRLLGRGDGTFAAAPIVADGPGSAALGDLDGDGHAELVVAPRMASSLLVLPGSATGLGTAVNVSTPSRGFGGRVALVDLDGDGALDAVVTSASGVAVLRGDGTGGLDAAANQVMDGEPGGFTVADVDGDDRLDLIATGVTSTGGVVDVRLGRGDGTFGAKRAFGAPYAPLDVAVGNLDGDGVPDAVVVSYDATYLLRGDGAGGFGAPVTIERPATAVALEDLDGDGRLDLVLSDGIQGDQVLGVAQGHGDGTFEPLATIEAPYSAGPLAFGDLDADLHPDLVLANGYDTGVYATRGGALTAPLVLAGGSQPFSAAIGDIDGDGLRDVAVVGSSGAVVFLNTSR